MSISITQTPATASLAQSPIIFTVSETNPVNLTSSSFQYVGELYYWSGSLYGSSSFADYTIVKFPNRSGVGIFDLNRIIYSTLTDLLETNPSNVKYFAVDFYSSYLSGSTFVTSSHTKSNTYKALDGYGIFPETIGAELNTLSAFYPFLTDGPVTQSVFVDNKGLSGVAVGGLGGTQPTKLVYSGSNGNGEYILSSSLSSSNQIQQYPQSPSEGGFPLSTGSLEWYTIQPYSGSTALGTLIYFSVDCIQKYPNVRIKWKNRFGQFDYYNFYMVSRQGFETEKRTYQPQLGTWENSTFGYKNYDSANLNYINDSTQTISVNSWYLYDEYNDIIKQLLVSDEIYWMYDESNELVRPLTIATSNIVFKTGVVDKLIQYQLDFKFGQPYKLIM